MTHQDDDRLGRLDDEAEERERSSTQGGPAAEGEYDAAQGSPGVPHPPTSDGFSEGVTRYDADGE